VIQGGGEGPLFAAAEKEKKIVSTRGLVKEKEQLAKNRARPTRLLEDRREKREEDVVTRKEKRETTLPSPKKAEEAWATDTEGKGKKEKGS